MYRVDRIGGAVVRSRDWISLSRNCYVTAEWDPTFASPAAPSESDIPGNAAGHYGQPRGRIGYRDIDIPLSIACAEKTAIRRS